MSERNPVYDRAKGILIGLVVLGHVLIYANPDWSIRAYAYASTLIYSFHMPAFFLISGILFSAEKWKGRCWKSFLCKRSCTLLIPFFCFEIIGLVYKSLILHQATIREGLLHLVTLRCNVGADWFLPALFFAQCLLLVCLRYLPAAICTALAAGSFAGLPFWSPTDGWEATLWRGVLGFAFMYVGFFLKNTLLNHAAYKKKPLLICCGAFLALAGCAIINIKAGANDFWACSLPHPIVFLVGGIAGLILILALAKSIRFSSLAWFGRNSLIIMGTHQLVLYTVRGQTSFLWIIWMTVLILAAEVIVIFCVERVKSFFSERGKLKLGH